MIPFVVSAEIFFAGCASEYRGPESDRQVTQAELSGAYSFAFTYKGDNYFFAPEAFEQDGRNCHLYLGFKNNKWTYAFNWIVFRDIEKVYEQNDGPDEIKKLIVEKIKDQSPTERRCYDLGSGPPPDAGQGEAIAILLFPIFVPYAAYAAIDLKKTKGQIRKITDSIHLGQPLMDIPETLRSKWKMRSKGTHHYYEYVDGKLKMILYFEGEKLNAWSMIPIGG